jgi:hypothetical protein
MGKVHREPGPDQAGGPLRIAAEEAGVDLYRAAGPAVKAQGGGKFRVGMEVRDKNPRFPVDDYKEYMAVIPPIPQGRQFFQVFQGPFRGGVGKHGNPVFHQGTGLYLYQVALLPAVGAEEVETGVFQAEFRPNFAKAGDNFPQDQFFRSPVGPGGKEGGYPLPVVDSRRRPAGLGPGTGLPPFQDQPGPGNIAAPVAEKFDKPPRVGAMTGDSGFSVSGDDEETVGPFYKEGFFVVFEQLEGRDLYRSSRSRGSLKPAV